jgi:hypothetical protein
MAAVVVAQANTVLAAMLAQGSAAATTGISTRLTTTAPTGTAAGTELTGGSGYTTGGTTTTWNAPSGGSTTNITVLTWTNSSGGSWSIVGIELWDQAGTPLRWLYGTWTGQPISIANGNTFQVAAGAITVQLT